MVEQHTFITLQELQERFDKGIGKFNSAFQAKYTSILNEKNIAITDELKPSLLTVQYWTFIRNANKELTLQTVDAFIHELYTVRQDEEFYYKVSLAFPTPIDDLYVIVSDLELLQLIRTDVDANKEEDSYIFIRKIDKETVFKLLNEVKEVSDEML